MWRVADEETHPISATACTVQHERVRRATRGYESGRGADVFCFDSLYSSKGEFDLKKLMSRVHSHNATFINWFANARPSETNLLTCLMPAMGGRLRKKPLELMRASAASSIA